MVLEARNILCPIEFHESFLNALMTAGQIAQRNHGTVFMMHAVTPADPLVVGAPARPQHDERVAERELEKIGHERLGGVEYKIVLRVGDVAEEVVKACRELGIDLLVMATHANPGWLHLLTNHVCDRIIHEAPCPVLTLCERAWPQK
jgi:universal stress protein A